MQSTIKYSNLNELNTFLQNCETTLFDEKNRVVINYPSKYIQSWDEEKIRIENEEWLKKLRHNVSVYAIFTASSESEDYTIKYIGQSKSSEARGRLSNHLIKKDTKTGAKLELVREHIRNGGKIKVSYILIEPESLRHYVEEELIKKYSTKLDWNKNTKSKT
jgi:predicted small secreted protein